MTKYFQTYKEATMVLDGEVLPEFPEARILEFRKGFAIQYYKSGYYYPHKKEALTDVYNPANHVEPIKVYG